MASNGSGGTCWPAPPRCASTARDSGLGLNDQAVACIRAARKLESQLPLWSVEPALELLRDREPNSAFVAVRLTPNPAYALYLPSGGEVTIDLSAAPGRLVVSWIDIETGEWGPRQEIEGGRVRTLRAPGPGNLAAVIRGV
jgi:hypothetical protein